jgi:molybdopterin-binding protein
MLEIKNISKSFPDFHLENISFSVEDGDYFVLLGGSGMGKSMLLEIISGITATDSGRVFLNGKDITFEKIQKRKLALVYQDQVLFPHLTVFDNIAYPLRCKKKSSNEIKKTVHELADLVEISNYLDRKSGTLSGGEAQRVALARALATEPVCLLLDEPLSNIDTQLRYELRSLLRKINKNGQTIIHVTHDYEEAISLANKLAVIEHGNIVQIGTPEEVFMYPKSEFIAKFIGVKNFYKGNLESNENDSDLKLFKTKGAAFHVIAEENQGEGFLLIHSENVVLSDSRIESSARNMFQGRVSDFFPARTGIEVVIDTDEIKITSIISREAFEKLKLKKEKVVWASFKASSVKFISI